MTRTLLITIAFLVAGCSQSAVEQAPPIASSAPPVEAVDPTSLVEGEAEIFGIRMPARTSVNRRTPVAAGAQIPWQFDRVASYFRQRLDAESVEVGPRSTIFRRAKIKGDTSGDTFNVIVKRTGHTAEVAFRKDVKPGDTVGAEVLLPRAGGDEPVEETPRATSASAGSPTSPPPATPTAKP